MSEDCHELKLLLEHVWPREAFADEAALRNFKLAVSAEAPVVELPELCQGCDLDSLDGWLAGYRLDLPRCPAQAASAPNSPCLPLMFLGAAGTYAAAGLFAELYVISERLLALLRAGEIKQSRLGSTGCGNGMIHCLLYGYLSQAKWEDRLDQRERLLSVEEISQGFCSAAERALSHSAKQSTADSKLLNTAIATLGVDVAAMQYRRYHETQPDLVDTYRCWYNEHLGAHLAAPIGHYLTHQPLADSSQYWTYELVKLHFSGCLCESMFQHCRERRQAAALSDLRIARHPEGTYCAWARQDELMLAAIRTNSLAGVSRA